MWAVAETRRRRARVHRGVPCACPVAVPRAPRGAQAAIHQNDHKRRGGGRARCVLRSRGVSAIAKSGTTTAHATMNPRANADPRAFRRSRP